MSKYSKREDYAIGIDTNTNTGKLVADKLRGKVDFILAKACEVSYKGEKLDDTLDTQFHNTVQVAYDIGVPCGAFIFHNPQYFEDQYGRGKIVDSDWTKDEQIKALANAIGYGNGKFRAVDAIIINDERWWKHYVEYFEFRRGVRTKEDVQKIDPMVCQLSTREFYNHIKTAQSAGVLPDVPVIWYSAKWYVEGYTNWGGSNLYDWVANMKILVWSCSPRTYLVQVVTFDKLPQLAPLDTVKPADLNGRVVFWQWEIDAFYLDINDSTSKLPLVDLDYAMMPAEELYILLGYTPAGSTTPEEPEVPEVPETPGGGTAVDTNAILSLILAEIREVTRVVKTVYNRQ